MKKLNLNDETQAHDQALDLLEQHRGGLITIAKEIAQTIAKRKGFVTSIDVFREMKNLGYGEIMDAVDPRWMGGVFRKGWYRVGYENSGSHKRPISVWKLKESA